jgi:GDP-4-dehydro-6-deoxy-D-mannose reductase
MIVLVTGADGFVGRWALRALLAAGHEVVGAVQPGPPREDGLSDAERAGVLWIPLELGDLASVRQAAGRPYDAVLHLAAVASGGDALRDPGVAWAVNAAGTARLLGELGRRRAAAEADPVVLLASSAEVYGAGSGTARPLVETDPVAPRSPYAASKVGAEMAAAETRMRTGLRVVIARSFPHTGPGQDERFVAPAFARRLRGTLLGRGVPGETYNVASGRGIALHELFDRLAALVGVAAIPEPDPEFMRAADIPVLVGDSTKLRGATGWAPTFPLDQTLRDLIDAQAD